MKKLLALVLALVMSMSLVTISNAADFGDADKISYKEAVDVMEMVGVLAGYDNGDFGPTDTLTRAQACKIIAYLALGQKSADALSKDVTPFADVPAGHWAAGFITYCYNEGIVSGVGDNKFAPEEKVTALQFAKMLLCVLGYEADREGMNGADWSLATAKLAAKAKLFADNDTISVNAPATREEAALYAFNALQAHTVSYLSSSVKVEGNGMSVTVGGSDAIESSTELKDSGILAYSLTKGAASSTTDSFGRPSYEWSYNGESVKATDKPVAVFTTKASAADVAKALKGYKVNASTKIDNTVTLASAVTATVDIYLNSSSTVATSEVFASGKTTAKHIADNWVANGKLVEVYADDDTKIITDIVEVTYTTAEMGKVSTDKKTGDVSYTIGTNTYKDYADEDTTDTISFTKAPAKGDIVTYVVVNGTAYVYPTTSFVGKQTATKTSSSGVQTITVSGSNYTVGAASTGSFLNSKDEATYYVDQYGFVVKTDSNATASTDYAYVIATEGKVETSAVASTAVSLKAKVLLADGTISVYNVELKKNDAGDYYIKGVGSDSNIVYDKDASPANDSDAVTSAANSDLRNQVFGYTVKDGTITFETLTALPVNGTANADNTVYVGSLGANTVTDNTSYVVNTDKNVLVNASTVFVAYSTTKDGAKVYTGLDNLPNAITALTTANDTVVCKTNDKGVATAQVIFFTHDSAYMTADADSDYVYVDTTKFSTVMNTEDENEKQYTGYKADGTAVTLVDDSASGAGLFVPSKDGKISGSALAASGRYIDATTNKVVDTGDNMIGVNGTYYYVTENTNVVYVDDELSEIDDNKAWVVLEMDGANVTKNVETIYVIAD